MILLSILLDFLYNLAWAGYIFGMFVLMIIVSVVAFGVCSIIDWATRRRRK